MEGLKRQAHERMQQEVKTVKTNMAVEALSALNVAQKCSKSTKSNDLVTGFRSRQSSHYVRAQDGAQMNLVGVPSAPKYYRTEISFGYDLDLKSYNVLYVQRSYS